MTNTFVLFQHITEFAAYLYDSVILYAEALSATLEEGEDPKNGTYIIQKIILKEIYQSEFANSLSSLQIKWEQFFNKRKPENFNMLTANHVWLGYLTAWLLSDCLLLF